MKRKKRDPRGGGGSKFNEEICVRICELAKRGFSLGRIAAIVGIHTRTILYWTKKYPDFLWSLNESKSFADEFVEKNLFTRAAGYTVATEKIFLTKSGKIVRAATTKHWPPDTTAQIFWLKNRSPKAWKNDWGLSKAAEQSGFVPAGEIKSFSQFCAEAGYPQPYIKQIEMMEFVIADDIARLLLGARGYGKTDYAVILGIAYQLYLDSFEKKPTWTSLLITKSDQRNAAILSEISKACGMNGMILEKNSATALRVEGLLGKDHSVAAVTIGSSSLRGRHPKQAIMEDCVTEEDISAATRRKVQRVYNEVNKLTKNVCVIGQPVHKFDLYETLRPKLKKLEMPHGSIPELDIDIEAQRLAGVSEESIQASYFLKVFSDSQFPLENCKTIDRYPREGTAVAWIDPSFTGKDYTALSIFKSHFDGMAVKGHAYKRAWNHCLDLMIRECMDAGVKKIGFETNNLGDQPVDMLREALEHTGIGVIGKCSTNNKHADILSAGAYSHLIYLLNSNDPTTKLYNDLVIKYEYGAEYDDPPDSLARGLIWIGLIRAKSSRGGK